MVSQLKYKLNHATPLFKTLHYSKGKIQVLLDPWLIPSPTLDVYSNVTLSTKPSLMALFKITILFPAIYPPSLVYFYP